MKPPGATSRRDSVPQSRSSCMLIDVPKTTASSTNMSAKPGTRCSKTVTSRPVAGEVLLVQRDLVLGERIGERRGLLVHQEEEHLDGLQVGARRPGR